MIPTLLAEDNITAMKLDVISIGHGHLLRAKVQAYNNKLVVQHERGEQ